MEKHDYICCSCSADWSVSLPGNGSQLAMEPCFSVPGSRILIGKLIWIAAMFECAVKRASRLAKQVFPGAGGCSRVRKVSCRSVTCCFKL